MNAKKIVESTLSRMIDNAKRAGIPAEKNEHGKIAFGNLGLNVHEDNSPWIHIVHSKAHDCLLWRDLIYNGLSKHMVKSRQFVHSGCQSCFKVIARPKTYYEMLKLEQAMLEQYWPSKIGIEVRPYVKGLYGAYFYNIGLDNAKETEVRVMELVEATIGSGVVVYTKNGCTEMEIEQGRSDKWNTTVVQLEIERMMEALIHVPDQVPQTDAIKDSIREKWRAFAWKYDPTYMGPGKNKECVRY